MKTMVRLFSLVAVKFDIQLDGDFSCLSPQAAGFAVEHTGYIGGVVAVFPCPLGGGDVLVSQPLFGFGKSAFFHNKSFQNKKILDIITKNLAVLLNM